MPDRSKQVPCPGRARARRSPPCHTRSASAHRRQAEALEFAPAPSASENRTCSCRPSLRKLATAAHLVVPSLPCSLVRVGPDTSLRRSVTASPVQPEHRGLLRPPKTASQPRDATPPTSDKNPDDNRGIARSPT